MNKKITCIVCNSKNIGELEGFKEYYFCSKCNTAWYKKFPKSEYKSIYYQGKSSLASKLFTPIAWFFYKIREKYVNTNRRKLWIDVGAGEGSFLREVGYEKKIGVEVSSSGRKMMERIGLETLTDKEFIKSKGLKADVISFWHVIEHLDDPILYIKSAYRNISPDGKLIIGIPNLNSFEFKNFKRNWFHLAPLYHKWHFSDNSIRKLLEANNFKVERIDYWSIEHHLTGLIQSIINSATSSENILHKIVKRQDRNESFPIRDMLIALFWLTFGLPFILVLWATNSICRKSGTMVIVATPVGK